MFPHERLNSEGEGGAVEENLSTSRKETDHLDRDKNENQMRTRARLQLCHAPREEIKRKSRLQKKNGFRLVEIKN